MLVRVSESLMIPLYEFREFKIDGNEDDGYNIIAELKSGTKIILKRDFKLYSSAVKYMDKLEGDFAF